MSDAHPRFSIIVPVYNTKRYLPKCIESLRRQTLRDIQIIIVDDGSNDGSDRLIDEYGRKDARISVVHQPNSGLAAARNSGIKRACGEYIGFVDSDDWVEADMFERLLSAAESNQADIAITGVKTVRFGIVSGVLQQSETVRQLRTNDDIFAYRKYCYGAGSDKTDREPIPRYVWNSGFRRTFIQKYHLAFQNALCEDDIFTLQALRHAACVVLVPGSPYCYRRDDQASITHSFSHHALRFYSRNMEIIQKLAESERKQSYREESLRRSDRHIIDLNRALIHRITESSLPAKQKVHYIHAVNSSRLSRDACSRYSWRNLPTKIVPLYWCQKYQLTVMTYILMTLWVAMTRVVRSKTLLRIRTKMHGQANSI